MNLLVAVLLLLVALAQAQKSYLLSSITVNQFIDGASCVVRVQEKYSFTFLGGTYSQVGIPIRLDSLYTPSPQITDVKAVGDSVTVTNAKVVLPATANDRSTTARFLVLQFPAYQGTVTFTINYNIIGYLASENNVKPPTNVLRWSTRWPIDVCICL